MFLNSLVIPFHSTTLLNTVTKPTSLTIMG